MNLFLKILSVIAIIFGHYIWGADSVFYKWMGESSNEFVKTVVGKVPAIISSVIIVMVSCALIILIKGIFNFAFKKNKRTLTIMSLMSSLIKWVIIIVAILLILKAFGVDTTTLLASAGILTLVIGFGAQSLVADILAGFFLVFEGEYDVGDIVSIDGWRGTVKDIGIRVTRIEDVGGNIKTINNSDVKNVINQTHELSLAKVIMPIDYGESLERVEVVLKENFEQVKANIPISVTLFGIFTDSSDLQYVKQC